LGGPGRYSLSALAREAHVSPSTARSVLQALGRPSPSRGERAYTEEDLELVRTHKRFLDAGLPRDEMLATARVLSQGLSQTAESIRQLVGNALLEPGATSAALGARYLQALDEFGPELQHLLELELRAHLRERLRGEFISEAERESGELADTEDVAVAFADLVDYTRLGEQVSPSTLGRIANKLAELAVASVQRPTRMVKTVGDAVMFVSPDPDALVRTVAELVRSIDERAKEFPELRVGLAYGAATNQAGDWFGPPVNLASRVTAAAKPGHIVATSEVVDRTDGFEWKRRRRRSFSGVSSRTRLFELVG
jgi:adenylate cyclase